MRTSLDPRNFALANPNTPNEPPTKSPNSQKDLIQKILEANQLKDNYQNTCKKLEAKISKLEEENTQLKSLGTSPRNKSHQAESEQFSASVYAFNSLSKELSDINKVLTMQESCFKRCIQSSDINLEASTKLQEKVADYINICKASDLHILKIIDQSQSEKSSTSENLKIERMGVLESPSLFDELKEFEEDFPGKQEDAILISEAQIARLNKLKNDLESLREEVKTLGHKEGTAGVVTRDYLINYALKKSINFLNI